jgi:hypothetical protein
MVSWSPVLGGFVAWLGAHACMRSSGGMHAESGHRGVLYDYLIWVLNPIQYAAALQPHFRVWPTPVRHLCRVSVSHSQKHLQAIFQFTNPMSEPWLR